jgi:hypothetical protein
MEYDVQALKKTTLAVVPPEKAFRVSRGDWINNITDLANCIESLSPDQFRYHVDPNGPRNHFAMWVRESLENPALAHDLMFDENLRSQEHMVKTIRDHIAWLEHS